MSKKWVLTLGLIASSLLPACTNHIKPEDDFLKTQMVFISSRSGDKDVYRSDMWGKNVHALTNDPADDSAPSILPDGQIVFSSNRTGTWQLYKMDWDGTHVQALTSDLNINSFAPYPAPGGRIVFVSDRPIQRLRHTYYDANSNLVYKAYTHLYSILPDGTDLQQITGIHINDRETFNDHPVVSEEGHIYFTSSRSSKWEVWKVLPDGSHPEQLTHLYHNVLEVAILPPHMPDGNKMTSEQTTIARLGMTNWLPQTKIVYTIKSAENVYDIYRQNIDGSEPKRLTSQQFSRNRNPVVLPAGEILFTSDRNGNTDIWSMKPDGVEPRVVIDHPACDSTTGGDCYNLIATPPNIR